MSRQTIVQYSILTLLFAFLLLVISGCDSQSRGFALPKGSIEVGKATFIKLACNDCHSVASSIPKFEEGNSDIHFKLGGPVTRVKTYGDLVTSIINPSHKISGYAKSEINSDGEGNSNMRIYNEFMTVQELVDITAYLETTYDVIKPVSAPLYGFH